MDTALDMTPTEAAAAHALEAAGISYIRLTHAPASTMELCRGIGAEHGAEHCKNLLLANKHGTAFYLLLMCPDKPYRTSEVSRRLGSTRLSFATEAQLESVLGLRGGSVSVMGLANPCAKEACRAGRLRVAIDRDLMSRERICVHPNENTESYVINTADIERFLNFSGIQYTLIEV